MAPITWYTHPVLLDLIRTMRANGHTLEECRERISASGYPIGMRTLNTHMANLGLLAGKPPKILEESPPASDKKEGEVNWRSANRVIGAMQAIKQEWSYSQDQATIDFSRLDHPIAVLPLGDTHFGSWATDHDLLERLTDELLATPHLYLALMGDMVQMAIKLRNVLEVSDNLLPPAMQLAYFESWLEEVLPRVLFVTWDNHAVMRQEAGSGHSAYAEIAKRRAVYFNHIGHADVLVGGEVYRFAASHRFRGASIHNPLHGQMTYLRREAPDRDIALAGDSHVPAMAQWVDGSRLRSAVNGGSGQVWSGYARRHFSLHTWADWPLVELYPDAKRVNCYWDIASWKAAHRVPVGHTPLAAA